jgi:uncharacterized protein (TIRG00374 family)
MMKTYTTFKSFMLWLIKVAIVCGIFFYLLRRFSPADIARRIVSADTVLVTVAVLLNLIAIYFVAYQLKIVMAHMSVAIAMKDIYTVSLATYFYNLLIPGGVSAGAIKWYKLTGFHGKPAEVLASMVVARLITTTTILLLGTCALMVDNPFGSSLVLAVGCCAIIGITLFYGIVFNQTLVARIVRFGKQRCANIVPVFIKNLLAKCASPIMEAKPMPPSTMYTIFILAFSSYAFLIAVHYVLALSVGIKLPLITIAWIAAIVAFVRVIPITISGLGIREGLLVFLLGSYGVPPHAAIAYALIIFGVVVTTALIGGMLEARNLMVHRFATRK